MLQRSYLASISTLRHAHVRSLRCNMHNVQLNHSTVKPRLSTVTPLRPPRYRQFIQNRTKALLKNPFNTTTLLIRSDYCGLLVTGITGFHCTCIHHLGLDNCFDGYNNHDSLQARFIEGIDN